MSTLMSRFHRRHCEMNDGWIPFSSFCFRVLMCCLTLSVTKNILISHNCTLVKSQNVCQPSRCRNTVLILISCSVDSPPLFEPITGLIFCAFMKLYNWAVKHFFVDCFVNIITHKNILTIRKPRLYLHLWGTRQRGKPDWQRLSETEIERWIYCITPTAMEERPT